MIKIENDKMYLEINKKNLKVDIGVDIINVDYMKFELDDDMFNTDGDISAILEKAFLKSFGI